MEEIDETIHVRASVYKAGEMFDGLIGEDSFQAAAVLRDYYRRAKDKKRAAFWKEIWEYLMTVTCVQAGTKTVIEPDSKV